MIENFSLSHREGWNEKISFNETVKSQNTKVYLKYYKNC